MSILIDRHVSGQTIIMLDHTIKT